MRNAMDKSSAGTVLGCSLISVLAFVLGSRWISGAAPANQGLLIEPGMLSLGDLWARNGVDHELKIHNGTARAVEIVRFETSCHCTSITPARSTIQPGDSGGFTVRFDLAKARAPSRDKPRKVMKLNVDVVAVLKGSPLPARWRLFGNVRNPIAASPAVVTYDHGELNATQGSFPSRSVTLECVPEVRSIMASCDPRYAVVAVDGGGSDDEGGAYRLTISPRRDLPLGAFEFDVGLAVTTSTGEHFATSPLPVRGTVVDDIEFTPTVAGFGPARLGESRAITVFVRSRTGQPFTIDPWIPTVEGLTIAVPEGQSADGAKIIEVRQEVSRVGAQSKLVDMVLRSPARPPRKVLLEVTYYGLDLE